jgi:Glycosyltransferase Family 4
MTTQTSASFSYRGKRIITVLQDLRGGGAERIAALLANGMAAEGAELTLLLLQAKGPVLDALSDKVHVTDLNIARTFKAIPVLARQFRALKPDVIIAHMTHINVAVLAAAMLAGCRRKVILVEHNQFDLNLKIVRGASVKLAYQAARILYLSAGQSGRRRGRRGRYPGALHPAVSQGDRRRL